MTNGAQFYEAYLLSMPLILGATVYTGEKVREASSRANYWGAQAVAYATALSVMVGFTGAFVGLANGGAGPFWDKLILYSSIFNVGGLTGVVAAQGLFVERPPRRTEQTKVEHGGDDAHQSEG
ncbi:hypothetical protein DE149_10532 [Micrococcus sp. KT16]|uniref:hypothetical protein n=1 Tax=Micrococcus sp. KT16 TaxID=2184005 RepID=UPI000DE991CC|nr:hypothetical protein [Micrococcus sp. KT16]RBO87601.1 hypothetical protein DE149_10532 [Micrococcus sp. KT16]